MDEQTGNDEAENLKLTRCQFINALARLASFHAGDNFMPKQLTKRGHRLVFSNGIIGLAFLARRRFAGVTALWLVYYLPKLGVANFLRDVLLIGLGSGSLTKFLYHRLPRLLEALALARGDGPARKR